MFIKIVLDLFEIAQITQPFVSVLPISYRLHTLPMILLSLINNILGAISY